jgi:hypothetical protein
VSSPLTGVVGGLDVPRTLGLGYNRSTQPESNKTPARRKNTMSIEDFVSLRMGGIITKESLLYKILFTFRWWKDYG